MNQMEKKFRFKVTRKKALADALGVEQELSITLSLTQEQFEDYHHLKASVHEKLAGVGINEDEDVYWREDPPVADGFIEKLRNAIGAQAEAQFSAYYAHSYHYWTYKEVAVEGVRYHWMSFTSDQFIKFAPSMAAA